VFEDFYGESADMLRWSPAGYHADELRETARRIVRTKREFNLLAGWTPEEDTLPESVSRTARSTAIPRGFEPRTTRHARDEYHRQRGW